MLLAIDVGNTEVTLGLFVSDRLSGQWRVTTLVPRTPDEWSTLLTSFLAHAGHSTHELRAAVQASVAPSVTGVLAAGVAKAAGLEPVRIGPETPLPIVLDVDEPKSVGADRVVNTLAAVQIYGRDTIIVDFGTATTFDCITKDGRFIGGVIAPGVQTAADFLSQKAAKLPATELSAPERTIGRRTEDCIKAGVVLGTADAVDGIVRRIQKEWPGQAVPGVIATGGLASLIAPLSATIEQVEPDLTLIGLRIAAQHVGLEW
jgi:type III pantothenate kinase